MGLSSAALPTRWQWNLTVWAWLLHRTGVPAEARRDWGFYDEVMQEVGINARARRSHPFRAWDLGRPELHAGDSFPGMRAAQGASFDRILRGLPSAVMARLDTWAAEAPRPPALDRFPNNTMRESRRGE